MRFFSRGPLYAAAVEGVTRSERARRRAYMRARQRYDKIVPGWDGEEEECRWPLCRGGNPMMREQAFDAVVTVFLRWIE